MNSISQGPIEWVQDKSGRLHYGVREKSRDDKEEKFVLKYVGDPVFGFKRGKTRISISETLCRDVKMEATHCHNAACCEQCVSKGLRENVFGHSVFALDGSRYQKQQQIKK